MSDTATVEVTDAVETRKRGRGRPVANATGTFTLHTSDGDVIVKVIASGKGDAQIETVERLAKAMRTHVSKNVKGIRVNGTPVVQF